MLTSGRMSKSEKSNCTWAFPLALTFTTHACDGAMKSFKSASLTAPENCAISSLSLNDYYNHYTSLLLPSCAL